MKRESRSGTLTATAKKVGDELRRLMQDDRNTETRIAQAMGMPTGDAATSHAGLILAVAAAQTGGAGRKKRTAQTIAEAISKEAGNRSALRPPFAQQLAATVLDALKEKSTGRLMDALHQGTNRLEKTPEGPDEDPAEDFRGRAPDRGRYFI